MNIFDALACAKGQKAYKYVEENALWIYRDQNRSLCQVVQ